MSVAIKRRQIVMGRCPACDADFVRRAKTRDIGKFCSRQCYFDLKRASAEMRYRAGIRTTKQRKEVPRLKACKVCGAMGRRVYCGRECELTWARRKQKASYQVKAQTGVCPQCHRVWAVTGKQGVRRFCSSECLEHWARRHRPSSNHTARARRAGVGRRYNIKAERVFTIAKWRCQLCGTSTPERLRGTNHPNEPTLDHIVPIALGGPHTYDNLQCACRACNNTKGASWVGQRRLLFDERSA